MGSSQYTLYMLNDFVEVDMKSSGLTKILTLDPGAGDYRVFGIGAEISLSTGTLLTAGTISIGTNGSSYNNVLPSTAVLALLSAPQVGKTFSFPIGSPVIMNAGASDPLDIYANVTAIATSLGAFTFKIRPWLLVQNG